MHSGRGERRTDRQTTRRTGARTRRRHAGPMPGRYPVRFGTAELLADADRPGGWLVTVDGVPQSYVHLDDPTYLEFEYARRMADVLDLLEPCGAALDAVHIGGAACMLPRYLAATRPGSRQLVIEADGPLVDVVREQLELRGVPHLRVRVGDGRAELATRRSGSADLIVVDAFQRAVMPGGLATVEFLARVAEVLRPGGCYLLNLTAGRGLAGVRRIVAGVTAGFPHVALVAEPAVLRGRRDGNLVVAASGTALPVAGLARRVAGAPLPVRLVTGAELDRFVGSARPLTDAGIPDGGG